MGAVFSPSLFYLVTQTVAYAGPDGCVFITSSEVTCSGNQSSGISSGSDFSSPPATTLNVNNLSGAIQPGAGTAGINFRNDNGNDLNLRSGSNAQSGVTINTTGDHAGGIVVDGRGHPTGTIFGVIPVGPGGSGGNVTVSTHGRISTNGDSAHGLSAASRAGGYPPEAVNFLKGLLGSGASSTFNVAAVNGQASNIGQAVAGDNGGTFTVNANGTYTYSLTGQQFTDLAVGASLYTTVGFTVTSSNFSLSPSSATLIFKVTRTPSGLAVEQGTLFEVYGLGPQSAPAVYNSGTVNGSINLRPDVDAYVTQKLTDSGVSGIGRSVDIVNNAHISTHGPVSYGIFAQSTGGAGLGGSSGVFNGSDADPGSAGGTVHVDNHGDITTHGTGSRGIYARSVGGDGGRGGDSGIGGNGGDGGLGAKGGAVQITNHGAISTEGQSAAGIFAQSLGGTGGGGGSSGFFGGSGGSGGGTQKNDPVSVLNHGAIGTSGNDSYGIFAQSVGGFAGSGGSASGIVAFGSSGGSAGQGGDVTTDNQENISTAGRRSHALFAQSVGGGGGNAGGSGALVALGGGGGTGGNGGNVSIINDTSLEASGGGSYGIYAQSVGGGGGNGGDSIGLVGIGGKGSSTSDGDMVTVTNRGAITSTNHAIFAESIGGGGGNGGSAAGWVSVGGSGGSGGDGKTVILNNHGNLSTSESNASAIFAQSVGGGGGNGGNSVAVGAYASVAVGGEGAGGGTGGAVLVFSDAESIVTGRNFASGILPNETRCGVSSSLVAPDRSHCGDSAHGIFAQSVGGGGGNGGFAVAGSVGDNFSVSVAVGGNGGDGGGADLVLVDSYSDITTHGNNAHGIFAQSVGGGGGNGGFAVGAALSGGTSIAVGMGGSGGAGGDGNTVIVGSVPLSGSITTHGDDSYGIFAQSVGKGGGNGGFAVAGNINVSDGTSAGVSLAMGGSGGGGGAGGLVGVDTEAHITTYGERSYGILAQSVGGGGGNGGLAVAGSIGGPGSYNASVTLGGAGGSGNTGGEVDVINGGEIETWGSQAHAIFAQSVGGGGGSGGMAISGGLGLGGNNKNLSVAVGGSGGNGAAGGAVTVRNTDSIVTHGQSASGIYAQSVGGGGGSGGASFTGNASIIPSGSGQTNINLGFAIGGSGASGDHGGNVTITNDGIIDTWEVNSHGIYAQSVGGGGGEGGKARTMSIILGSSSVPGRGPCSGCSPDNMAFNLSMGGTGGEAGDGGIIAITNNQSIHTRGSDSHGIWAQSVGGGGGSGGEGAHGFFGVPTIGIDKTPPYKNVSISMGGSQGSSGEGKAVTVTQTGNITTAGDGSFGVFAQSVGGGGGSGGHGAIGFTGTVGVGGAGGAAGNGGDVTVSVVSGNVATSGTAAHGIFAQSVGGGGGIAGNIERGLPSVMNFGLGLGITKNSGNGGDGGTINVNGAGNIHTTGDASNGIFAQSVGGGGGIAGDIALGIGYAGSAGGNGSAGEVNVSYTGNIVTEGNSSHGIFAQSGGGTAHNVQVVNAAGDIISTLPDRQNLGNDINVSIDGNVIANGADSNGIFLHSQGSDGNGNITVTIQDNGRAQGGSGAAAGVRFEDGANNTLTNRGIITTSGGVTGMAVGGTGGSETVENFGTVTGSVDLGAGGNAFNNKSAATFNSGSLIDLGVGNLLQNDGTLSPGAPGTVFTSSLTGNLLQATSGTYSVDLDISTAALTGAADRLNASGTGDLAGRVDLNVLNSGFALPGRRQLTILSAAAGLSNSGLELTFQPSAVINYQLAFPNSTDMALAYSIDFAPQGLNENQSAIGNYINAIQLAGGSATLAPIVATLFGLPDAQGLADGYNHLTPEVFSGYQATTLASNLQFSNAMLSCRTREGQFRFIREGECGWMTIAGNALHQERTSANLGFNRNAFTVAGGFQKAISANWHLGVGLGYDRSWLDVGSLASSDGNQVQGGVIAKGQFGATSFSATISGGHGWYNAKRSVNLPTPGVTAKSDPELSFVSNRFRLAHDLEQKFWYARPMIDLGINYIYSHRFNERGAGAANLDVRSENETYVTLSPGLEIGGEIALTGGVLIRPFAKVGLTHLFTGNTPGITASLQGAPAGVAPFTVTGKNDKNYGDVSLGLDVLNTSGVNVRLGYTGQFSKRTESHGGHLKLSIPF